MKTKLKLQWRPIETAPKDGTIVLLIGPEGYETMPGIYFHAEVGYYDEGVWRVENNGWFADGGRLHPSHWFPLPKFPGLAEARAAIGYPATREEAEAEMQHQADEDSRIWEAERMKSITLPPHAAAGRGKE